MTQKPGQKSPRKARTATPPPQSSIVKYRTLLIGLAAGAGALVIVFVLLQSASGKPYVCDTLLTPPPDPVAATGAGFATDYLGNTHVPVGTTIRYRFCPPTSGNHYSSPNRGPIRSGVYGPGSEQVPGGWVHNLEHGSVVVLYRCPSGVPGQGDCPSTTELELLHQWFDAAPADATCGKQAVVARFDAISTRFAVLAWNRALLTDTFDLDTALDFANRWTDTNAPEPAQC